MNLETVVLLSELIASIAVVVTLVYLAKQVKQSTRQRQWSHRVLQIIGVSSVSLFMKISGCG